MNFSRKTALIPAVFLLLGLNGCYTKFAHRGLIDMPDQPGVAEEDSERWDFGYGWYRPIYQSYDTYHDYYYGEWWENCPWLQDADSISNGIDYNDQYGKIGRRDYYNFPAGVIIEAPATVPAPDTNFKTPSTPGKSEPIVKDNNDTNGGGNEPKSEESKLKRRGGR